MNFLDKLDGRRAHHHFTMGIITQLKRMHVKCLYIRGECGVGGISTAGREKLLAQENHLATANTVLFRSSQLQQTAWSKSKLTRHLSPPAGGMVGQRLSDHPDIRKLGFTGSTPIGKQIMKRFDLWRRDRGLCPRASSCLISCLLCNSVFPQLCRQQPEKGFSGAGREVAPHHLQ